MLKVQIHSHPYYQINNSHFGYNLVQNCSETLIGFVWAVSYSKNSHPGKYRGQQINYTVLHVIVEVYISEINILIRLKNTLNKSKKVKSRLIKNRKMDEKGFKRI